MYTVACMLCLNMRALRVFMMPPLVPGPDSVDTPVPGPGSQESWTLDTASCPGFPGADHWHWWGHWGHLEQARRVRSPGHLATSPPRSTRSQYAASNKHTPCYMLPPALCYDNLSILTFSGAVKTIKGDHVEIIYILPPTVSVQYAVCMFVS